MIIYSDDYILCCVGPTEPPKNLTATVIQPHNATITWQEVSCVGRNGEVTEYQIFIEHGNSLTVDLQTLELLPGGVMRYVISDLRPLTTYNLCLKARVRDIAVAGPCANVTFTTISNSKFLSITKV